MKRQLFSYLTMTAIAILVVFTSCDNGESSIIQVQDKDALNQTMFADQTSGKSGVTIITEGAWTSTIKETSTKSTRAEKPSWISITPDHGDTAGTYTISITLEPNTTGTDRTAIISILCNGTNIAITVCHYCRTKGNKRRQFQ